VGVPWRGSLPPLP